MRKRAVDPPDVVAAGAVAREAQAEVAQIVRVGRFDQIALVLYDRDLADVERVPAGGEAGRPGDAIAAGLVEPEGVEETAARVAVRPLGFPDRQIEVFARFLRLDVEAVGLVAGARYRRQYPAAG